ncbi:hypothetical protein D922_04047 [Enterococcus faecalis 06-MB-DW-09]|nr:hypothetical protein D922_04047 [Enterococcus faecalis 06-MB-DW-09]
MTIKLREITIENVKNVEGGSIKFKDKGSFLNVVGIYGQNGSGKTTLIDVASIIQKLVFNQTLSTNVSGMLTDKIARITTDIEIPGELLLRYIVSLQKISIDGETKTKVIKEEIQTRVLEKYKKIKHLAIYDCSDKELLTLNVQEKAGSQDALQIISDVATDSQTSFLFSNSFRKLIHNKNKSLEKNSFYELYNALDVFTQFARNLRIYTSEFAGLISANIFAPVSINYRKDDREFHGVLPFKLRGESGFVPKSNIPLYESVIKQINILLPEIIPGLTLDMTQQEIRLDQDGKEEVRLEFISRRGNAKFSLHYESDGIKKIIAMINFLVEVYNDENIIAFIDELDAGVYEYLLGELISVMSTGAKGQLIFTSHNLRILEMLDTNKIIVSTVNPQNRYIRLKGVKGSNNLRDFYLRTIQLSGQEEELYQGKSAGAIRIALMKAGREIG